MIDTNEIRARLDRAGVQRADVLALCDEIDRLRAPKPQGKMVRARMAIAVDTKGRYAGIGYTGQDESGFVQEQAINDVTDFLDERCLVHIVTADLPIPEETTVEAEVENA